MSVISDRCPVQRRTGRLRFGKEAETIERMNQMPINGTGPLDSDDAKIEFRKIAFSIIRRVNYYTAATNDPKGGNPILGDLMALAALGRAFPLVGDVMAKTQVAEWREKVMAWLESVKIPKKIATEYKANALALLDELDKIAVNMSKGLCELRAHHQGMAE